MNQDKNKGDLKRFFIKLAAITLSIIIIINISYNLIFAEKLENISKLLLLSDKENVEILKNKMRSEIRKGLNKDKIVNDEDRILLYKFYLKLKKEFKEFE